MHLRRGVMTDSCARIVIEILLVTAIILIAGIRLVKYFEMIMYMKFV